MEELKYKLSKNGLLEVEINELSQGVYCHKNTDMKCGIFCAAFSISKLIADNQPVILLNCMHEPRRIILS